MLLEVIASSLDDVIKINQSKAHRIELVQDMAHSGLTPEYEIIKKACEISKIPIHVMVRRKWKDFIYSEKDMKELLADIDFIKTTKAAGIVFGSLTKQKKINVVQLQQVVKAKEHLKLTFHKAFDVISDDLQNAYEILADNQVDIVLTSGGKSFVESEKLLKTLVSKNKKPTILIGGGVNLENFKIAKSISNNVHVGSLVKVNFDNNQPINVEMINKLVEYKKT